MKTIEMLYKEVLESDELKKAFVKAAGDKQLEAFLKENGCEATIDEVNAFLTAQQSKEGAVSDAELGSVSGGCNELMALVSTISVGIGCLAAVAGDLTGPAKDR